MFAVFMLSLIVSPWISLILHEMGHALAGGSMKMKIREIRLGQGPTIFRKQRFGSEIRVALIPIGGRVTAFALFGSPKVARLVFIAAGPVVDMAWFSVLIVVLQYWSDTDAVRVVLFPALAFQLLMILSNLIPHYSTLYDKRKANDMLAFWQTAWAKDDSHASYRQLYLDLLRPYAGTEAPLLSDRSDRIFYFFLEVNSSAEPVTEQQVAALEHERSMASSRSEQLLIMDTIAMHILAGQGPFDGAYLDGLTQEALSLAPDLATLKRTRGAALARLGRHDEALVLLAGADDTNDTSRCLSAAFRGLAHFHAGRMDQATVELEIASAIVQSQNWTNSVTNRIVDGIIAEISHTLLGSRRLQTGR